jgi:hypothetical protein
MKRKCVNTFDLSIDWIHNLVYYKIVNKIFVLNVTNTRYEYVVIEEEGCIRDLSVNPLDSILFYSITNWNGLIIKQNNESITGWPK